MRASSASGKMPAEARKKAIPADARDETTPPRRLNGYLVDSAILIKTYHQPMFKLKRKRDQIDHAIEKN
jgi:hypothetical protein